MSEIWIEINLCQPLRFVVQQNKCAITTQNQIRDHYAVHLHTKQRKWAAPVEAATVSTQYILKVHDIYCIYRYATTGQAGEDPRVPGVWGSQISRQLACVGGKGVSLTHRPTLLPRKYSWYSYLLEADSTSGPQCESEGLIFRRLMSTIFDVPHR